MKKDLSRRQFLHRTAGAAGALAASPAIFLEPEHIPLPMQSTAPSDRLRFGIIGIGMQGSGLLRDAIQLPGVECVAACDLYDGRHTLAQEIVSKKIPTTRRYKDLLDNKEIDCLIAAVPDHWHKQVVVDAASAGKDIYCEKPMSHSAADGVAMVAAAQKSSASAPSSAPRPKNFSPTASSALSPSSKGRSAATILPAPGNIRRRPIFLPKISIGKPGKARCPRFLSIPISSRAGAAGRNMAPALPATFSFIWSAA